VQILDFGSAGSQTVTTGWPRDTSGDYWVRVHILTPNDMTSNQASFRVNCAIPDIDIRPTTVDLGWVACGSDSGYDGVVIKNVGYGGLDISSASITSGGSYFRIADDSCTGRSLSNGQQCTISILFGPLGVCGPSGTYYNGNLRIRSNDPDEGTVNVGLVARQP